MASASHPRIRDCMKAEKRLERTTSSEVDSYNQEDRSYHAATQQTDRRASEMLPQSRLEVPRPLSPHTPISHSWGNRSHSSAALNRIHQAESNAPLVSRSYNMPTLANLQTCEPISEGLSEESSSGLMAPAVALGSPLPHYSAASEAQLLHQLRKDSECFQARFARAQHEAAQLNAAIQQQQRRVNCQAGEAMQAVKNLESCLASLAKSATEPGSEIFPSSETSPVNIHADMVEDLDSLKESLAQLLALGGNVTDPAR